MDTTTLAAAALSFGAGFAVGRATGAPDTPPSRISAQTAPPPMSAISPAEVARALSLHGALGEFDPAFPSMSSLQQDLGTYGTTRYAEGQTGTLALVRFEVARMSRAAESGDLNDLIDAVQGFQDRIATELGYRLSDNAGIPTWERDSSNA